MKQPQRRYHLRSSKLNNFKNIVADVLLAQHDFSIPQMNHLYDATGREKIDTLLNGNHAQSCWNPVLSNERGRVSQSNDSSVEATNTIQFIP